MNTDGDDYVVVGEYKKKQTLALTEPCTRVVSAHKVQGMSAHCCSLRRSRLSVGLSAHKVQDRACGACLNKNCWMRGARLSKRYNRVHYINYISKINFQGLH